MSDQERQRREAKQRITNLNAAIQDTRDLRGNEQPRWQRLRQHLAEEGIAVEDAVVAERGTADTALESGIVLARDGRAFYFEFDFLRDEEGKSIEYEDARVSEWEELDDRRRNIFARELETGREVLERPSAG